MNLLSFLSLALGTILLAGFATLILCAKFAPEGYEDADGFQLAPNPSERDADKPTTDVRHAVGVVAGSDAA